LLWNMIEFEPSSVVRFSTEKNFLLLSELLFQLLKDGFRDSDKDLRNDVLIVCCLLASVKSSRIHFARTPLLRLLLDFNAKSDRLTLSLPADQTVPSVDFEMKKLLWTIISDLPPEPFCTAQIVQNDFVPSLFQYLELDRNKQAPAVKRWALSQLLELQMRAVVALQKIAEHVQEQYISLSGNEKVLAVAVGCSAQLESDEKEQYAELQALALDCLFHICSSVDFSAQTQGPETFESLIQLLSDPTFSEQVRTDAACILSIFLDNNPNNQRSFRRRCGPKHLIDFLRTDAKVPVRLSC
jgi:hypothetical protein